MINIYLVRHGETINNIQRRNVPETYNHEKGCPDPELNDMGIKQAHLLGRRLQNYDIDMVYASDLLRTQKTANIINQYIKKDIETRIDLREIDMGELHLRGFEDLKEEYVEFYYNFNKHETDMPYPNGENGSDVEKRVMRVIKEIIEKNIKNTLIVTHGGVIKTLLSVFLGLPMQNRFNFLIDNCAITSVSYDSIKNRFKVNGVNDGSHLEILRVLNDKLA